MKPRTLWLFVVALPAVTTIVGLQAYRNANPQDGAEQASADAGSAVDADAPSQANVADPAIQRAADGSMRTTGRERKPGSIRFPDGATATPAWCPLPRASDAVVAMLSNADFVALQELATAGDAFAARKLATLQDSCMDAPATREELEYRIDEFQQTQGAGFSGESRSPPVDAESVPLFIEMMMQGFERCRQVRYAIGDSDTNFLKLAADNGHGLAMLDYANRTTDRGEAEEYYERAWKAGQPEALRYLSRIARRNYENGSDLNGLMTSVAYFVAYATLRRERLRAFNNTLDNAEISSLQSESIASLEVLLPSHRDDAVRQAREIVRQNPNCCVSYQ